MVRGAVIGIKENDYFQAARVIGERTFGTLLRHVLPNIMAPIIVIFSITIGGIIVAEASLSFLGFGLPPGVPSWGGMLSREGRQYMEMAPRLAIWPGLCLTVVVYSINMHRRRAARPARPPAARQRRPRLTAEIRSTADAFADPRRRAQLIADKGMMVLGFHSERHRDTPVDLFATEPFDFNAEYATALVEEVAPGVPVRIVRLDRPAPAEARGGQASRPG